MSGVSTSPRVPTQARAERTRSSLLCGAEHEFDREGYARTTAKTIARRAGVATGSFYQYFRDKDAVLLELARQRMTRLGGQLAVAAAPLLASAGQVSRAEALAAARAIVRIVLDYHRSETGLHAVLTERRHANPDLDALTTDFERAQLQQVEDGLVRAGRAGRARAKGLAFVLFGMVEGTVHSHVLALNTVSDRRLIDTLAEAMVDVVG